MPRNKTNDIPTVYFRKRRFDLNTPQIREFGRVVGQA